MTRKNIILTASFCILCVMVVMGCIMLIDKVNTTKAKLNQSTVVAYNDFIQNKHDEYKNRIYENIIVSKKLQQKLDIYNKAVATTSQWSAGTHKVCIMDLHDGLSNVYGTPFQRISCIYWSEQSCGADDSTSVDIETEICNENIAFKQAFTNVHLSLFPSLLEHLGTYHRKYSLSFYLAEPLRSMVYDTIDLQTIKIDDLNLPDEKRPQYIDNLMEYMDAYGGAYDHTIIGAVQMYMDIIGISIDINILQNEDPLMKEHLRQEDCIGMVMMSVTDSKECCTGLICTLLPYVYELRMNPHDNIHTTETKKYKMYNNDVVTVSKTDEIFSYARPSDMTKRYAYQSILNALNFMKYIIDDCVTDEIVAHEALFN